MSQAVETAVNRFLKKCGILALYAKWWADSKYITISAGFARYQSIFSGVFKNPGHGFGIRLFAFSALHQFHRHHQTAAAYVANDPLSAPCRIALRRR